MKPILFSFRRCPYAMRARLALAYTNIDLKITEVSLKNKPQSMLLASPKGTVPVLVLENGIIIDESLDIMLWALKQRDPQGWLSHQVKSLKLITANDHQFKPWLDRYKYSDRFSEHSQTYYRTQGTVFLQQLEDHLEQHLFLHAQQPSLADYAIFPFVRQFVFVDKGWFDQTPNYPKLQVWFNTLLHSTLFTAIMHKQATK